MIEHLPNRRGCSFLTEQPGEQPIFVPEDFTEEQKAMALTTREFMNREVLPLAERLENKEPGLMRSLLEKASTQGLLMIDVPEEYGGLELDKVTSMRCAEEFGSYASFSVSHGAHTGIGMLPLLFFGNEEQKRTYLPRMIDASCIGAYALTEPNSGSDALSARTTATRVTRADGSEAFVLQGTKMWITNAGFADLFTVFAKVDGEHFTAFLVEAAWEGVSTGAEEHKMGLHGSSTRLLNLDNVEVPATHVLGDIGRGHKIAFNILNFGRYKLGVGVLGAIKRALGLATRYADERVQFGQPIAQFGAIRQKLGRMAARTFALESMCYRVAGDMDVSISSIDKAAPRAMEELMAAIEELAVEDSIMKIYGSETLDYVVDEGLQIHGGLGYSREYEIERLYRDSRINRIFEGTNEINRLLIPGMLLRRMFKGEIDLSSLLERAGAYRAEAGPNLPAPDPEGIALEVHMVDRLKAMTMRLFQAALQRYGGELKDQQYALLELADALLYTYVADSACHRTMGLVTRGMDATFQRTATQWLVADAVERTRSALLALAPALTEPGGVDWTAEVYAMMPPLRTQRFALEDALAESLLQASGWPLE